MVSLSSSPFGHNPRDSNRHIRHRPPTPSSTSRAQSPLKLRKNIPKESMDESNSSNHRLVCSSRHHNNNNNQEVAPPPTPLMSRRQARVLDWWAAQQARETITTIEQQNHCKYDISAISDSNYSSFRSSCTSSRGASPAPSDCSVSSLVQKWREFEATESTISAVSSLEDPFDQENKSCNNWEVDQASATSNREKDMVRVVDIMKKLPLTECREVRRLSSSAALCSPRIRGRQAAAELFSKLERDRYSEVEATSKRQAVSKFPKRGFLQTMLKLRLLRFEVSIQNQTLQEPHVVCQSNELLSEKCASSSSINNLRERFSPTTTNSLDFVKVKDTQDDKLNGSLVEEKPLNSNQEQQSTQVVENNQQEEINSPQSSSTTSQVSHQEKDDKEHSQPEMIQSSKATYPEIRHCNEDVNGVSQETTNMNSYEVWRGENEGRMENEDEEKEEVYDNYAFYGTNLDWINDVSRPRSYWESLRQAWYQEILTTSSYNEIRQLIERGSVATVLASDFRYKMDRILTSSSVQQKDQLIGFNNEDESHSSFVIYHSQMHPSSIHLKQEQEAHQEHQSIEEEPIVNVDEADRRQEHKKQVFQENPMDENEEEEKQEPETLIFHQFNNRGYYYEQVEAPLSDLSWRNDNNQEDSDVSEQFESMPHQEQSSVTNSFDQDTPGGSSIKNNSSIELELIYDLRAHMEQMYREMSELRKSLNHCVDMQANLQSSIKDEVSVALSHSCSKKAKGKESNYKVPKKGCCICYEKKVDSVLYRCGHMCACFKCAHELQWSSGKCPICRAQIMDVVRVFTHA